MSSSRFGFSYDQHKNSKSPRLKSTGSESTGTYTRSPSLDEKPEDLEKQIDSHLENLDKLLLNMHSQDQHGVGNVFQEEMHRVKTLVKEVTRERVHCEAEMKRQQQATAELKVKCSGYQQKIVDTKKTLDSTEGKVKELESQLHEAATSQAVVQSENNLLQEEVKNLQRKLSKPQTPESKPCLDKRQSSVGQQEQVEEKISKLQDDLDELKRSLETIAYHRKKAYDTGYIRCKRELAIVRLPVDSITAFLNNEEVPDTPTKSASTHPLKSAASTALNEPKLQNGEADHDRVYDAETEFSPSESEDVQPQPSLLFAVFALLFPLLLLSVLLNYETLNAYMDELVGDDVQNEEEIHSWF